MRSIEDAFQPVLGAPSWLVRQGHGSFLTLEFGEPTVTVSEPRRRAVQLASGPSRELLARQAVVHGKWHLWIYCCEWTLASDGDALVNSESARSEIERALSVLNGQALTEVAVDGSSARSRFSFDLGCVLTTVPAPAGTYDHEPVEQWFLYQPADRVLTLRSDGCYADEGGQSRDDERIWHRTSP